MNMNVEELRFPSGRSVERARQDAKRLSKDKGIPLKEALDQVCAEHGSTPPWERALEDLKSTGGHAYRCFCCDEATERPGNPLMVVKADFDDGSEEHVHLSCAHRDSRYDFCRFCGDGYVYLAEDINEAGECPDHEGESIPDYPEEDRDSYIENIQNNS